MLCHIVLGPRRACYIGISQAGRHGRRQSVLLPYWLLFGICALGSLITYRSTRADSRSLVYLTIVAIAICLLIGLRDRVGGDWYAYVRIFKRIELAGFFGSIGSSDPGYILINWLSAQMGGGLWLADLLCAVIFTAGLISFCSRQPSPWLALVVAVPYLIIVVAMGYTRQATAIGLVMFGLSARGETTLLRMTFFVTMAATFHKTAIVVLPLFALARTTNRFMIALLSAATALLLYYLFVSSSVDLLMRNYVIEKYASQGAAIRIAMDVVAAIFFFVSRQRLRLSPAEDKLWRNFSLATLLLLMLLALTPSSTAIDRMALYVIPLQLLVLSRLPLAWGLRGAVSLPITAAVIGYSGLVEYIWLTQATNASTWIPYRAFGP
jgi:hypothetical protein